MSTPLPRPTSRRRPTGPAGPVRRRAWAGVLVAALLGSAGLAAAAPAGAASLAPTEGASIVQISTGYPDTCALLSDGTAWCWGGGLVGALGNGDFESSYVPVTVLDERGQEPLQGITQIAVGQNFVCALLDSTEVRCWGYGNNGQLGNGGRANSALPVAVSNPAGTGLLTGVTQISAGTGSGHACARLSSGELRCWGNNFIGQIGSGGTTDRLRPTTVRNSTNTGPLTGVAEVAAGQSHTCARLTDGTARCWGEGQGNGDGSTANRPLPVVVSNPAGTGPLGNIVQIAAGRHACALLASGTARCWGANYGGQLGTGTRNQALRPVTVSNPGGTGPLSGVVHLETGEGHTCAMKNNGQDLCWGYNNHGQVGDGSTTDRLRPVGVANPSGSRFMIGATGIDGGGYHSCAVVNATIRCWGFNEAGEVGDGTRTQRPRPVTVIFP